MNEISVYKQLTAFLRPLGRRLRWRLSVEALMRAAWVVLAACAVILLAGRLWPLSGYRLAAGGVLVVWLMAWAIYSLVRPVKPFSVARRADGELGLYDRLSTALVLSDPKRAVPAGFDRELVNRQLDDALAVAQSIEPRQAFAVRIQRGRLVRAAAALLAGFILFALPNPMDAVVAQREQIAQTARAEADKLEKLAQEVEPNTSLNPEEKEKLLRQLRDMVKQLKSNPGDAKKALADLAKWQEQLRSRLDPSVSSEAAAIEALAQQLAKMNDTSHISHLTSQMPEEAARLLEQLASELDKLSPEEREALASALERAAAQTAGSNPDLAKSLSAMAQAARAGESGQEAQRAATQAAQAIRQSGEQQALQQALARALNQAEASQRAVAQAGGRQGDTGTRGHGAKGQGQGQPGQSQPGQGQGQGQQGQGQGQGQPGGGGGTTANTLPPAVRTGQADAPTDPNKPFVTGDISTVYAPFAVGQGREEFVGGQPGQGGQATTSAGQSPQPGAASPALVPYSQVYQQYMQIAGQAMERAYIPSGLRDYVKEYFSKLEP